MDDPSAPPPKPSRWIPRHSLFFLALVALLVVLFELLRLGMILRNFDGARDARWTQLLSSFLYGLRFDVAIACYVALPLAVLGHLPGWGLRHSARHRRIASWVLVGAVGVMVFLLLAEYEFYREFQTRYNQLAFQYLDQPKVVVGMVWYSYPVVRYVLVCLAFTLAFALALRWVMRRTLTGRESEPVSPIREAGWMAASIVLLVIGMRGGLQDEPLRWGNAYHGDNDYVNQMSLNGLFALGQSGVDHFRRAKRSHWQSRMPIEEARAVARGMVVGADERLVEPAGRVVLRTAGPAADGTVTLRKTGRAPNVVLMIMESFSARFVGACGSPQDRTPRFDQLASEGVLFDHAFSGGTHTHQGVFCSTLGFPNLPGYEYLMENIAGNQSFLSLPAILKREGYQTMFLYNGNLAWDNMAGFFRKQGIDRFIGSADYVNPTHRDRVWGVTDRDVFDRANDEFEAADKRGPFFSVLLTLSNHVPFDLPDPLPFERTTDMGDMNRRTDGVRYADWALGRFMDQAKAKDYYRNTLFVFVGDHGFHVAPKLTEAHVLFHHVPLLFHSPLLTTGGKVIPTTASQLNILPTVVGLLGLKAPQASWARDLFATDYPDENFAIFKGSGGSGSDQAVAMVRGDKLLVMGSDGSRKLWQYELNPNPGIRPLEDVPSQVTAGVMQRQVYGYVQAAMAELSTQKAGPRPGELLHTVETTASTGH